MLEAIASAEHRALRPQPFVEGRGAKRPACGQLLVRKDDREAAPVVLNDAAALGEAGHHGAGDVEVAQAGDRSDQWIAVRSEGERAVDHPFDSGLGEHRLMLERDLEARSDPIQLRR